MFGESKGEAPPYYLRVEHQGENVTERIGADQLLFSPYPLPEGRAWHYLSAGSAVRLIKTLLSDQVSHLHVPGPDGLPGGYPVQVSDAGIQLDLPDVLPVERAIEINSRSHRFDGIERIEGDGTVVFTEKMRSSLNELIGFSLERMNPAEAEQHATELIARFHEFAREQGVALPNSAR